MKLNNYFFNCTYLLLIVVFFNQNISAQKAKQKAEFVLSLESDEKIITVLKSNSRINKKTGIPIAIYDVNFDLPLLSLEDQALYYLQEKSQELGFSKDEIANLHHHLSRSTAAGSVVRFRQYFEEYPVNKAEVTISISPQNKVVMVMNEYQKVGLNPNILPTVLKERAYDLAYNYLDVRSEVTFKKNRLMVYKNTKTERLAYEVTILTSNPLGEWHVFIDAQTEEIFKVVDENLYYKKHSLSSHNNCEQVIESKVNSVAIVNGTGMVFNPDPLSFNTLSYGGNYVDNNDITNVDLDNARVSVVLKDIEEVGGVYKLKGPRAEIIDFDAPNNGLFTQNSSDFNFTRDEQGFEAVNIYYHIDFMMDYVNNTLGINALPQSYIGGVRFDPHGSNGADNSFFSPGSDQLSFGEGCVDDGEDSDVIHHELGHGLHDFITGGSDSTLEGLGEGFGDYVAQSYNRSLGNWVVTDTQYNWLFNWDGHNECWDGRITNYTAIYPAELVGDVYIDGQIWSSCLMGIWDQIGKEAMDKIFYEGLAMTNGSSNQNDAANAVYQAAINLNYTNSQLSLIHTALTTCGYTLPILIEQDDSVDSFLIYPNPTDGSFTLKLNSTSTSKINVHVYDIIGKTIFTNLFDNMPAFEKTLELDALQSGVYLIKVTDGKQEFIDKIIVD